MYKLLKLLSGQSSVTLLLLLVSTLMVSSCSGTPLSLLTGGGPNVAANTQIGKENIQALTTNKIEASGQAKVSSGKVNADRVETVVVNEYPLWMIIALVVTTLLDSPVRMIQDLVYGRKRKDG